MTVTLDEDAVRAGLDTAPANGKVTLQVLYDEVKLMRREMRPALDFYQRVLGVLAVIKWMGLPSLILILGALIIAFGPARS
jgi:hypothetical protein